MNVQIFGLRKSADTRKALRFFSERRIRTHFVDLAERAIAEGELQRFIERFGIEGVLDRESKRFEQLGLRAAQLSSARWIERLAEEPGLLRLPLVRRLGQPADVTVGYTPDTWGKWLSTLNIKPS